MSSFIVLFRLCRLNRDNGYELTNGVFAHGHRCFLPIKRTRFLPFFLTQFFGAFNDNAFKLAMLTLISYHLTHGQAQSEFYQAIAGTLFIIPFFFFPPPQGN